MELLIEILLMALDDTERSTEDLRRLASVCRYWRDVIVKTLQFWMFIDIHHGKGSWSQVLSRNPAGPLDVRIWGYRGFYWRDADRFRDFVNLLKPESKRIRSIDSKVPLHSAYIPRFLNGAPFPMLSDIKMIISPPPWTPYLFNVGDGVPFQHLELSGVVIPGTRLVSAVWRRCRYGGSRVTHHPSQSYIAPFHLLHDFDDSAFSTGPSP